MKNKLSPYKRDDEKREMSRTVKRRRVKGWRDQIRNLNKRKPKKIRRKRENGRCNDNAE